MQPMECTMKTLMMGLCTSSCLEAEEMILPEEPVLPENPMVHEQKMWDLCVTAMIKNEENLRQNMHSLYAVMISLCDSNMEDKVKAHEDYLEIKCTRNTIKLLQMIKQYMYSKGSEELHNIHNQVMSTINLFQMRQERGQSAQNFWYQFTAMQQLCDQLGLCIGQMEQGAKAVLKREGVTKPSTEQLKQAKEKAA